MRFSRVVPLAVAAVLAAGSAVMLMPNAGAQNTPASSSVLATQRSAVTAPPKVGVGEQYTITATGYTPGRYVELKVNGQTFGWPKVAANGTASFTNGTWEAGTFTIEARQDATGPTATTTITVGNTTPTTTPGSSIPGSTVPGSSVPPTSIVSNGSISAPARVGVGEQYTITATGYTPNRYVELKVNGQTFGWPKVDANGTATFTNGTWETGTFTIEARQDGTGPAATTAITVGNATPTTTPGSTTPGSTIPPTTVPPTTQLPPQEFCRQGQLRFLVDERRPLQFLANTTIKLEVGCVTITPGARVDFAVNGTASGSTQDFRSTDILGNAATVSYPIGNRGQYTVTATNYWYDAGVEKSKTVSRTGTAF
jgi:GW (Gly-Tryp) dipeptide domain